MKHKKDDNKQSIGKRVMAELESGRIKMKPRWYFVMKSALLGVFVVLLLLSLIYLGSLVIFVFRANDLFLISQFGWTGWRLVLSSFPWYLVIGAAVLIVVIELTAKRSTFVYRRPLIYSLLLIIIFSSLGSWAVERTTINRSLSDLAQARDVPVAGRLYERLSDLQIERVHKGRLVRKQPGDWFLELDSGEAVVLDISTIEQGRRQLTEMESGQRIIVIGDRIDDTIEVERFRQTRSRKN